MQNKPFLIVVDWREENNIDDWQITVCNVNIVSWMTYSGAKIKPERRDRNEHRKSKMLIKHKLMYNQRKVVWNEMRF